MYIYNGNCSVGVMFKLYVGVMLKLYVGVMFKLYVVFCVSIFASVSTISN